MTSLVKQIVSKPVSVLRNNEIFNSSASRMKEHRHDSKLDNKLYFASANGGNDNKNNTKNTSLKQSFHHMFDSKMLLEQEFIMTFIRRHADTSILRSISLTSSSYALMDPLTLAPTSFQQIDEGSDAIVNTRNTHEAFNVQRELAAISTQIASDMLVLSIRTNLPFKLIQREYTRYQRRKRMQSAFQSMQNYKVLIHQLKKLNGFKIPAIDRGSCLTGRVNGLPNYSSTCFFNAVVQALASATPFVRFLERIVVLEDALDGMRKNQTRLGMEFCVASSSGLFGKKEPLSRLLLDVLQYVNAQDGHVQRSEVHRKIRQILDRVASEKEQFKSYRHHSSKEQQDAQEFLQALIAIIVEESHLEDDDVQQDADIENENFQTSEIHECERGSCDQNIGDSPLFSVEDLYDEVPASLSMMDLSRSTGPVRSVEGDMAGLNSATKQHSHGNEDVKYEEKKQEIGDAEEEKILANDSICDANLEAEQVESTRSVIDAKTSTLTQSMQMMVKGLSSKTPSPLSGRFGSRLQCCECRHVKPIHESSFLEIPVVPTMISKPMQFDSMQPCHLEECLNEFTEIERVEGVNCHACPIKAELANLKEEMSMLEDAMGSVLAKGSGGAETSALKHEWNEMQQRFDFLININPDDEHNDDDEEKERNDFDPQQYTIPEPLKVDYEKRLIVTRLPPILCLHVKRLHYNSDYQIMKCNQHIAFPEYLDVNKLYAGCDKHIDTVSKDVDEIDADEHTRILYRLISVIEHHGNAFSGHYITYRRISEQALQASLPGAPSNWVYISDEKSCQISWKDLRNCNAYMLVYEAI